MHWQDKFGMSLEGFIIEELAARDEPREKQVALLALKLDQGAVLPARQGASGRDAELAHVRILELTRTRFHGFDVVLQQSRQKVPPIYPVPMEPALWVLRNSNRKEALLGVENLEATFGDYVRPHYAALAGAFLPQSFSVQRVEVCFRPSSVPFNLENDWFQNAELMRIRISLVGYLTKPVVLKTGSG
jgi:hypothetical protein